jgi:hypothetical protein
VRVLALLALAHVIVLGADHNANAAEIVELVFTSLYSDHDDGRLAKALLDAKMTQQLSPLVVGYFKDLGIGPEALTALQTLQNRSKLLSPPDQVPLLIQPIPTESGQRAILRYIFQYANSYVHSLPNFLCDEVMHRYTNAKGIGFDGKRRHNSRLTYSDTISRKLRFGGGEQREYITESRRRTCPETLLFSV